MKFKYLMLLVAGLSLAACQNNETPPAATSSTSSPTQQPAPTAQNTGNAVEVKKSVQSTTAKAMQQTMDAAKQQAAATVEKLAAETQTKPEVQKPVVVAKAVAPKAPVEKTTPAKVETPIKAATVVAKQAPAKAVEKAPAAKPVAASPAKPSMLGDAAKGQSLARKCKACHNFTAKKKVGPGLAAVYGRKAGIMPDMKYSASLAAGGWNWDDAHLAAWVCEAKKAIKTFSGDSGAKTKMGNQRICDPAKQADLIAYLKTL